VYCACTYQVRVCPRIPVCLVDPNDHSGRSQEDQRHPRICERAAADVRAIQRHHRACVIDNHGGGQVRWRWGGGRWRAGGWAGRGGRGRGWARRTCAAGVASMAHRCVVNNANRAYRGELRDVVLLCTHGLIIPTTAVVLSVSAGSAW
jgi:hypothetical protein